MPREQQVSHIFMMNSSSPFSRKVFAVSEGPYTTWGLKCRARGRFAAADPHQTSRGGFPGVKFLIAARMGLCDESVEIGRPSQSLSNC